MGFTYIINTDKHHTCVFGANVYSATRKMFPSDALICTNLLSYQLYYATNPHCLALHKVVEVIAMEKGHPHSENFMGCTVQEYCVLEHPMILLRIIETDDIQTYQTMTDIQVYSNRGMI